MKMMLEVRLWVSKLEARGWLNTLKENCRCDQGFTRIRPTNQSRFGPLLVLAVDVIIHTAGSLLSSWVMTSVRSVSTVQCSVLTPVRTALYAMTETSKMK